MTASVITKLAPSEEDSSYNFRAYELELKGKPAHGVAVRETFEMVGGKRGVRVSAMVGQKGPAAPLSTMDAIARKILPGARVVDYKKGSKLITREYAV